MTEKSLDLLYNFSAEPSCKSTTRLDDLLSILKSKNYDFPNDFWRKFYDTFKYFDPLHPGFNLLFDGVFLDFIDKCLEYFILLKSSEENNISKHSKDLLFKIISKHKLYKTILKYIKSVPQETSVLTRFTLQSGYRKLARNNKRTQVVNLDLINNQLCKYWDSCPNDFTSFYRGVNTYSKDFEELYKKMQSFVEMDCSFLAEQMKKDVEDFKKDFIDVYFGFNRIKLTQAALILAKVNDFTVLGDDKPFYTNVPNASIYIDKKFFNKIIVKRDKFSSFDISFLDSYFFIYEPKLYNFETYLDIAPSKEMAKLFVELESFEPLNYKPAFDHYKVLVPSVQIQDFIQKQNFEENLIKSNLMKSVVIGEKDGKCYFICYWN